MSRLPRAGRVFVISSPSGGGKTTVVSRLLERMPQLARSVSVTTRSPRPNEHNGRAYRFVSSTTFHQLRQQGRLLEWTRIHGACYGTPRAPVAQALARGRDVVLSIDVQGARQVRRALHEQAVLVFLLPPSRAELRARLEGRRTDSRAEIRRRLAMAQRELACAEWYDDVVVNDHLDRATRIIEAIMTAKGSARRGGYTEPNTRSIRPRSFGFVR